MIDYTQQAWYNANKGWNENYNAFLEAQKAEGYELGNFTGTTQGDMEMYTDLKIRAAQENEKIANFNLEKQKAFEELRIKQDNELQDLGNLWQTYEDNNYTIPE